jgi:3-oxoacyl-[acyl-carrier protein] reductase
MDLQLQNKTALITGGNGGVGSAISKLLAQEGCNVVIADINIDNDEVVNECRSYGVAAGVVYVDLSDSESSATLIERAEELSGPIDILINNAGYWPTDQVVDITLDEWRKTFDINMTSLFQVSQAFVKTLFARGQKGNVLNVTSQAAFNGSTTGHAHYAASKSAVVAFTTSLSREVAPRGINVNSIVLGIVETPMINKNLAEKGDYYVKRIPVGRVAKPEEIANLAVFLVSGPASYFSGAAFDATGGMIPR